MNKKIYPKGCKVKICKKCGDEFETVDKAQNCSVCSLMASWRKDWNTSKNKAKKQEG